MENKTMAAAFAVALVVLAGAAFAAPNWFGGFFGGQGTQNNQPPMAQNNATWQNQTGFGHGRGFGYNMAVGTLHERGMGFNATNNQTVQEFKAAVQSGDYQTALQLHQQYGIGGPVFDRLNATTFATYSQIYNLQGQVRTLKSQLGQAIGMNMQLAAGTQLHAGARPMGMMARQRGFSNGRGMRSG